MRLGFFVLLSYPEIEEHGVRSQALQFFKILLVRFQEVHGVTNLIEQVGKIVLADESNET